MDSMSRRIAQTSTLKISPQEGTRRAHESLALLPQEDGQNDCVKDWEASNATYGSCINVDLDNHRSSFAWHVNMLPTR